MKFLSSYWLYVLAAIITIVGLITGWYLFIFLVIPFSLFTRNKKKHDQ